MIGVKKGGKYKKKKKIKTKQTGLLFMINAISTILLQYILDGKLLLVLIFFLKGGIFIQLNR